MTDEPDPLADEDVVTALHYDDPSLAEDLTAWCGGELQPSADDGAPIIWVPTAQGPRQARLGDWIIRRPSGDYYTCDAQSFVALHMPLT